jgi:hypothetical protein
MKLIENTFESPLEKKFSLPARSAASTKRESVY